MQEDRKLKLFLVLQSFCPLFILLFIRHAGNFGLVSCFFTGFVRGDWTVFEKALKSPALGDVTITILCILSFLVTVVVAKGFDDFQYSSYGSYGEKIAIGSEKKDSGATFFVTFLLPLLVDDVSTLQRLISFVVLLAMVMYFLLQSNLYYQNPVLAALGYKVFEFCFSCTSRNDVVKDRTYIGISKGALPSARAAIKRKHIADDVYLIYDD